MVNIIAHLTRNFDPENQSLLDSESGEQTNDGNTNIEVEEEEEELTPAEQRETEDVLPEIVDIVATAAAFAGTSGMVRIPTSNNLEMCEPELSEADPVPVIVENVESWSERYPWLSFILGCVLAFMSGLTVTINNFIAKASKVHFGEVVAVRGIVQIILCVGAVLIQREKFIPETLVDKIMAVLIGIFGGLTIMSSFACVKFMPVGDAMTLIFTNPLFTMIFAAIFLKHRLSFIKILSGAGLMGGIILVTKPPFLFPAPPSGNSTHPNTSDLLTKIFDDYLDRGHNLYDLTPFNRTILTDYVHVGEDPYKLYYVGAIVALFSAILNAANNILMAKMGGVLSASLQLLYIGFGCFIVSGLGEVVEEGDRFFTPDIVKITGKEWGIYIALALIGMTGFVCTIYALIIVCPSTAATLRTSQIIVAFIAQIVLMGNIPSVLDIIGALLIFASAITITFEPFIQPKLTSLWRRCRGLPDGNENNQECNENNRG